VATTLFFDVTPADTALALGSGDVEVLATPRLLAWCEAATVAELAELTQLAQLTQLTQLTEVAERPGPVPDGAPDRTSVGSRVSLEHLAATPVGGRIEVTATLEYEDGRLVRFRVAALDRGGKLVGTAEITRVVVDRARFLARLPPP
jgi:predicted thioesterase